MLSADEKLFLEMVVEAEGAHHPTACRVSRLEIFDEVEEWHLLSGHYCVSWAVKGNALSVA